jgi:hypothetical protein
MYPADVRASCGVPATRCSGVGVGDATAWMVKRNTTVSLQKGGFYDGFFAHFGWKMVVFGAIFLFIGFHVYRFSFVISYFGCISWPPRVFGVA